MARKLKTYVTSAGFFEEAIAAPSMKAALDAWGSGHNLFHQGFAKETDDPAIIAATMEYPGAVLKRPVGSRGPFKKHAETPTIEVLDKKRVEAGKEDKAPRANKHSEKLQGNAKARERKAAAAYEREKKNREQQRREEESARKKIAEKRDAALAQAKRNLDEAQKRHDQNLVMLEAQQAAINEKIEKEEARWDTMKKQLQAAIDDAKE